MIVLDQPHTYLCTFLYVTWQFSSKNNLNFSDFAFFGYELDEFLAVAKKDDPNDSFHKIRQWARVSLTKKFFPYREKFHEGECDETYQDPDYNEVPQ